MVNFMYKNNMKKRQVVLIHGGESFGTHEEYVAWLKEPDYDPFADMDVSRESWTKNLAEDLGEEYQVITPSMPNALNAKYEEWAIWLGHLHKYLHDDVIFIGNSLGANFLAKYLNENVLPVKISQLHLVAGCFGWSGGFELRDDLSGVENQVEKIYLYHSSDDPTVDYADAQKYQVVLPKAKLMTFDDRGHFRVAHFPEILENIMQ